MYYIGMLAYMSRNGYQIYTYIYIHAIESRFGSSHDLRVGIHVLGRLFLGCICTKAEGLGMKL